MVCQIDQIRSSDVRGAVYMNSNKPRKLQQLNPDGSEFSRLILGALSLLTRNG